MSEDAYEVSSEVTPPKKGLNLVNKITGITRLSPKIKLVLLVVCALLFMLFMFALDGIDGGGGKAKDGNKKDKEKIGQVAAATVPLSVTERPDVIPVRADAVAVSSVADVSGGSGKSGPVVLLGKDGKPLAGSMAGSSDGDGGDIVVHKNGTTVIVPRLKNDVTLPPDGSPKISTADDRLREAAEQRRASLHEQAVSAGSVVAGFSEAGSTGTIPSPPMHGSLAPPSAQSPSGAAAMASPNGQEDQNKQGRKERFLGAAAMDRDDGYLTALQREQITKYELKAGSIIPCALQSGINSDLPGLVRGIVTEDVHDSRKVRYLLIPKGTQTIGAYDSQVAFGQKRLLVVWSKMIFPNGSTMTLQGMPGADQSGAAGLVGDVNNHWLPTFGAALATSVIMAGIQASQGPPPAQGAQPTMSQTMAASLGQQLGQVGMAITQKNMAVQPTIETFVGARFYINVTKDMVFQGPYSWSLNLPTAKAGAMF